MKQRDAPRERRTLQSWRKFQLCSGILQAEMLLASSTKQVARDACEHWIASAADEVVALEKMSDENLPFPNATPHISFLEADVNQAEQFKT
jgi:hypothetical protein